jgi:hopanoid biosynthesis associated protein HpnK
MHDLLFLAIWGASFFEREVRWRGSRFSVRRDGQLTTEGEESLKNLIVTGDDFGLAVPVNEAIEEANRRGILGSASLMVGAPAAQDAILRARRLPDLNVGLHLVLARGHPVLPPEKIPSLVDGTGRFRDGLVRTGFRYFFLSAVRRQLKAEIHAQFGAFRETGLRLDHVNAHNHMHLHPTILGLILQVIRDYGFPAVRLPCEPFLSSWRAAGEGMPRRLLMRIFLAPWTGLMRIRLNRNNVPCNDFLFGLHDTGRMGKDRVLRLLAHLPQGVSEMYFHPATTGWQDPSAEGLGPEQELEALLSREVAEALEANGIRRTSYGELEGERRRAER